MTRLQALNSWLTTKSGGEHHRQILVIELSIFETLPILNVVSQHYNAVYCISRSFTAKNFTNRDDIMEPDVNRYQAYLGNQTNVLIFDTRNGINLNALYAFSGMVESKGLVIMCISPSVVGGDFLQKDSPQNNLSSKEHNLNGIKHSFGYEIEYSNFLLLLKKQLQHSSVAYVSNSKTFLPSSHSSLSLVTNKNRKTTPLSLSIPSVNTLSERQNKILNTIITDLQNHPQKKQCHVILGERGRGKSTLLGNIGAQLAQTITSSKGLASYQVITCAITKRQLHECNLSFASTITALSSDKTSSQTIATTLAYYPADEIITLASTHSIVLLDEMASIAPRLLRHILDKFTHVIMTGTTNGYEGSGQGFLHRVLPFLQKQHNASVFTLKEPFRWHENDPVEFVLNHIINCTTYDNNEGGKPSVNTSTQSHSKNGCDEFDYKLITKQQLLDNASLCCQIFDLLAQAHYQTTPNDLVRMLDAPDCLLFVACTNANPHKAEALVVAVATVFVEGGDKLLSVCRPISLGHRRVQGHLSAQMLALHLLDESVCTLSYFRVNRIAVKESYRRHGIATTLLNFIYQYAQNKQINYVSTSYGYAEHLNKFWHANKFTLAKLGQRVDTSSGKASVLMLRPCASKDEEYLSVLQLKLHIDLDYYQLVLPAIFNLYTSLQIPNLSSNKEKSLRVILQQRAIDKFLHADVSFNNIAPTLLDCVTHTQGIEKDKLIVMFRHIHTKGLHKQERKTLQEKFVALLFPLLPPAMLR